MREIIKARNEYQKKKVEAQREINKAMMEEEDRKLEEMRRKKSNREYWEYLKQWFSNFLESLPLGNAMIGHHYPLVPFPFSYVKLKEKILGCLVLVHFICKKIILL